MFGLGLNIGLGILGGGGGGGGWSPATPSGLKALFDARVGVTATGGLVDGNEITAWADQSGAGKNVAENVASTVFYKAAMGSLNVPAVRFIGSPQACMKHTASNILTAGSARTILVAGQNTAGTNGTGTVFAARTGDHAQASQFLDLSGTQYFHGDDLLYSGSLVTESTLVNASFCAAFVYTGAGNAPSLQINGSTKSTTGSTQGTEDGATGFTIGGMMGTATYTWTGGLWMVAVYDNALGSTDLASWNTYCQAQFGTP